MSKLEVDAIEPQSGTTITIGASGDTVNLVGTLQSNGSPLPGDISEVVAGTGLSGGGTTGAVTINIESAQPTITSLGTLTALNVAGNTTLTTTDNSNTLSLVSTDADANSGPILSMRRESGSPADNDLIGQLDFIGKDSGGVNTQYASIKGIIKDVTHNTEDGALEFLTFKSGFLNNALTLGNTETVFNDASVDVDFRVESNGNANMLFVDGGNDRIGIGTSSPQSLLHLVGSSTSSQIIIENTDAGSAAAPDLFLYRNSSSPADSDSLGNIEFRGKNSAGAETRYAINNAKIIDTTSGTEDGQVEWQILNDGNFQKVLTMNPTEIVINEDSNDTNFRVESDSDANALFVDGGQNRIGVGTGNPQNKIDITATTWDDGLLVKNTGNFNVAMIGDANRTPAGGGILNLSAKWNGTAVAGILFEAGSDTTNKDDGQINFRTASAGTPTERMRITSNGGFLFGKTSSGIAVNGVEFESNGKAVFSRSGTTGGTPMFINRNDDDGELIRLAEGGTTIGLISSKDTNSLCLGTGNAGLRFFSTLVLPATSTGGNSDNALDLGYTGNRWATVYAGTGSINTSDETEKQSIQSLTTAEMNVGRRLSSLIKTFKFNDAVEVKGDNARTHTGIIAQDVQQAFTDEGLNANNYALFCSDTWWEKEISVEATEEEDAHTDIDIKYEATEGYTEKTRLGLRYSELFSFIQAYNDQRFTELEARITTLENA